VLRSRRDRKVKSAASRRGGSRRGDAGSRHASGGSDESGDAPRSGDRNGRGARRSPADGFVLYVEGARDRELLEIWARRVEPAVARCIEDRTVILGGRQPARALIDFRKRGGTEQGWRGLVVLDRDHHDDEAEQGDSAATDLASEPGLELFVWGLRHIESYLLVPSAIRRMLAGAVANERVDQVLALELAANGFAARAAEAHESLHAKRLLGAGGSLSEALGQDLRAGEIARAMRPNELHEDVRVLLARIGSLSGVATPRPEVVIRRS
jgi:hypothetical protein